MQLDLLSILVALGAAAFVYLDGRHRRKKTDSRLWFWVQDIYQKGGWGTPPTPPSVDDSVFSKERKEWNRMMES
jgi:hypothetical protein